MPVPQNATSSYKNWLNTTSLKLNLRWIYVKDCQITAWSKLQKTVTQFLDALDSKPYHIWAFHQHSTSCIIIWFQLIPLYSTGRVFNFPQHRPCVYHKANEQNIFFNIPVNITYFLSFILVRKDSMNQGFPLSIIIASLLIHKVVVNIDNFLDQIVSRLNTRYVNSEN